MWTQKANDSCQMTHLTLCDLPIRWHIQPISATLEISWKQPYISIKSSTISIVPRNPSMPCGMFFDKSTSRDSHHRQTNSNGKPDAVSSMQHIRIELFLPCLELHETVFVGFLNAVGWMSDIFMDYFLPPSPPWTGTIFTINNLLNNMRRTLHAIRRFLTFIKEQNLQHTLYCKTKLDTQFF
jgi:hypothetical protein